MRKIEIELDDTEEAAFDILKAACVNGDPAARWTDATLAHSMLMTVIADDLACAPRPVLPN